MAHRMTLVLVTLNDLEGHSPFAGLFKCNLSNILQYFTRLQLTARSFSDSWASCDNTCMLCCELTIAGMMYVMTGEQ